MKKRPIITLVIIFLALGVAAGIIFSGVLVIPTRAALAKDIQVQSYDILEYQNQRELDLLADYSQVDYSPENPYILQDPYQANPLSAMVLFETDLPAQTTITVVGVDQYTTFAYTFETYTTKHELPVLGLYPGVENKIVLDLRYQDGTEARYEQGSRPNHCLLIFRTCKFWCQNRKKWNPGLI